MDLDNLYYLRDTLSDTIATVGYMIRELEKKQGLNHEDVIEEEVPWDGND